MSKRGEPAPRPAKVDEWRIMSATGDASSGWDDLSRHAPGPLANLYDRLTPDPRHVQNPERQGRLKGQLVTVQVEGKMLTQWQFEITGAGRVWYAPDDDARTVWIVAASTGHPKQTD
jgi:hypothetical protein